MRIARLALVVTGLLSVLVQAPALAVSGAVSSAHPLATAAGIEMLKRGGNAFDAAIATSLVIGVVEPQGSGIGGGGFALVWAADPVGARVLDFREVAPLGASSKMYQDKDGKVISRLSLDGPLAVAVPGQAAGLVRLQKTYAKLPLTTLAEPAIRLAREGFIVTDPFSRRLSNGAERLRKDPEAARIFLPGGEPPRPGQTFKQTDLARTLEQWAKSDGETFYRGSTATAIAEWMGKRGLVTLEDLKRYEPVWRTPLVGNYRGIPVVTMPPPGSGTVLLEMLNILEGFEVSTQSPLLRTHVLAQAMSRAYADRSRFLGDPAFVPVPVDELIAKAYARALIGTIALDRATPAAAVTPGSLLPETVQARFKQWEAPRKAENTSHLSVMDSAGNTVALTQTINGPFGAGVVASGTGILLNNEMDDFSSAPDIPNLYGLVGQAANAIQPLKRPLSSMTPTILLEKGKPWVALGSPGGSFITTAVLQTIVNVVDLRLPLGEAVNAPRMHNQWLPDRLLLERNYPVGVQEFDRLGYKASAIDAPGNVQAVQFRPGQTPMFVGASDARREGTSQVWIEPEPKAKTAREASPPAALTLPSARSR